MWEEFDCHAVVAQPKIDDQYIILDILKENLRWFSVPREVSDAEEKSENTVYSVIAFTSISTRKKKQKSNWMNKCPKNSLFGNDYLRRNAKIDEILFTRENKNRKSKINRFVVISNIWIYLRHKYEKKLSLWPMVMPTGT